MTPAPAVVPAQSLANEGALVIPLIDAQDQPAGGIVFWATGNLKSGSTQTATFHPKNPHKSRRSTMKVGLQ